MAVYAPAPSYDELKSKHVHDTYQMQNMSYRKEEYTFASEVRGVRDARKISHCVLHMLIKPKLQNNMVPLYPTVPTHGFPQVSESLYEVGNASSREGDIYIAIQPKGGTTGE